jgi:UDP-N-acetylmuramoyl-L-alanyl-D-glutamate--2,6-diaminopimelate ligase
LKLKDLFHGIAGIKWIGNEETVVTSVTVNSKLVVLGSLFLIKRGIKGTGHKFAGEAVALGAVAILTDIYDPTLAIAQIIHPNVNDLESIIATRLHNNPSQKISTIGVTGTCGKTTTTFLIRHLLKKCGLIGSVQYITGKRSLPSYLTTPELPVLLELLCEMKESGYFAAAVEVSSQGIALGRVRDVVFSTVVFTNLSHEHLDYHKTIENYAATKAELFKTSSAIAVVNGDDPWSNFMIKDFSMPIFRYGLSSHCDLYADNIELSSKGVCFDVCFQGKRELLRSKLMGKFNVYNILAATTVALQHGLSLFEIAQSLKSFEGVPGRLEVVKNCRGLQIIIDYAHTPEALKTVLKTCSEFKQGRLITVFGCGGDRDSLKRPIMASIAESFSDYVIITTDNPRFEDPMKITDEIVAGFSKADYLVELDRKKALEYAIAMATKKDLVLIIGKGHETYQIFENKTIEWDDRTVLHECLEKL